MENAEKYRCPKWNRCSNPMGDCCHYGEHKKERGCVLNNIYCPKCLPVKAKRGKNGKR